MAFLCSRTFPSLKLGLSSPFRGLYTTASAFAPSMKVVPYKAPPQESYDEKNLRLNRPTSPHLLIYKPQVTTMLSITHRGTGLLLSAYVTSIGVGALILPEPISSYIDVLSTGGAGLFLVKLIIALPLAYHFANGIRHLVWDTGRWLSIKGVYNSGYVMLAIAAVLTVFLASL